MDWGMHQLQAPNELHDLCEVLVQLTPVSVPFRVSVSVALMSMGCNLLYYISTSLGFTSPILFLGDFHGRRP